VRWKIHNAANSQAEYRVARFNRCRILHYLRKRSRRRFCFFKSSGIWESGWRKGGTLAVSSGNPLRSLRNCCYSTIILQGSTSWPTFSPSVNGRLSHLLSRGLAIARNVVRGRSNVVCRDLNRERIAFSPSSFLFVQFFLHLPSNWRTSPSSRSGSPICDYCIIDSQCGDWVHWY